MGDVTLDQPVNPATLPGSIAKGDQILDLMSTGWTNERHSLYISSMEASFMDQLYGHEHHGPVAHKGHVGGNGFKVLREAVPENLRCERKDAHACEDSENPCIKRFRPRNSSVNRHGDGAKVSVDDGESGTDTVQERVWTHGGEAQIRADENLVGKSTEVSDQNFPDEEVTANDGLSRSFKKRRSSPSTSVSNYRAV